MFRAIQCYSKVDSLYKCLGLVNVMVFPYICAVPLSVACIPTVVIPCTQGSEPGQQKLSDVTLAIIRLKFSW